MCVNGISNAKNVPSVQRSHKNQTDTDIYACKCSFRASCIRVCVCVRAQILGPQCFSLLHAIVRWESYDVLVRGDVNTFKSRQNWVYKETAREKYDEQKIHIYRIRSTIHQQQRPTIWKWNRKIYIYIVDLQLHTVAFTSAQVALTSTALEKEKKI